jgi:hypothetical protein
VGISLSEHLTVVLSTAVASRNTVKTPESSVISKCCLKVLRQNAKPRRVSADDLLVRIVRIPPNIFRAQKTFMQDPRKSSKTSASFEEIFFPGRVPQPRLFEVLCENSDDGVFMFNHFLWRVVKNRWYWGTPYFPNLNPYGDFVPEFAKATFLADNQTTATRYCWQHSAASVEKNRSAFVSNFLCWLQVVFDTGDALRMMLPDCQCSKTNERTTVRCI